MVGAPDSRGTSFSIFVMTPQTDILSPLLESLKVDSASLASLRFRQPWSFDVDYGVAHAFTVATGRCWYDFGNGCHGFLEAGDTLLLPVGGRYVLADGRSLPRQRFTDLWLQRNLPTYLGEHSIDVPLNIDTDGEGPPSRLFSFAFSLRGREVHPLLKALPEQIVVRKQENPAQAFVEPALGMLSHETEGILPGYAETARQLAELFVTQWVRVAVVGQPGSALSGGRGLGEPAIARALHALHRDPGAAWTLEGLARVAGLARSTFAKRFVQQLGETPMRYLARWRVQCASELLMRQHSVGEVAARMGYGSERAFRTVFKSETGHTPSSHARRSHRSINGHGGCRHPRG